MHAPGSLTITELEKLVKGQRLILPARRLSPNGFAAWAEVLHRGWEGMVAKDPAAPYIEDATVRPGDVHMAGDAVAPDDQARHALALDDLRSVDST